MERRRGDVQQWSAGCRRAPGEGAGADVVVGVVGDEGAVVGGRAVQLGGEWDCAAVGEPGAVVGVDGGEEVGGGDAEGVVARDLGDDPVGVGFAVAEGVITGLSRRRWGRL